MKRTHITAVCSSILLALTMMAGVALLILSH
jgi:hypothetical protein